MTLLRVQNGGHTDTHIEELILILEHLPQRGGCSKTENCAVNCQLLIVRSLILKFQKLSDMKTVELRVLYVS